MAYEALENLQQTLDLILQHRDDLVTHSVKQEIISIRDQAIVLQLNLKNYPNRERIREAATETHEILEYLFSEENVPDGVSIETTVRLANRLRELAGRLESTVGDVVDCIMGKDSVSSVRGVDDSSDVSSSSIPAAPTSSKDGVVGFEGDLEVIKALLLERSANSSGLQVLPIVGTGGIGKTTLAKIVYNDASIIRSFSTCAWITVSQDYSIASIVLNLLASLKGISTIRDAENVSMESLVRKYLKYRRYLIVMDDMWSKKAWDDLRMLFPETGNGSRIIVTTRLQDVATYVVSSGFIHTMRLLDGNHSWDLLKQKVFADKEFPIELEDIGKKFAKNCGGLPLSIVVAAGLLSKIHTRYLWKQMAANDVQLETIICLSYTHLPSHSKACFLYMVGFPEDYEILVSELIKLWVAEGFVTRSDGSKSLEEEAENCLEDLVERSLVLVTSRKFDGKIKSCSLHDLVREFCVRQAGKERLILPVMDYLPTPILRRHFLARLVKDHHSISATSYDLHLKDFVHSSHIRTIICIPKKGYRSVGSVEKFTSLRVLHVLRSRDHWDWDPGQVFGLIHLTYLASNIPSSIVPSAISKLQNLETLKIYRSDVHLPVEIWRLRQLRHLIAFSFQPLPDPEEKQIPLENLPTLWLATDLVFSERMVRMIPNIKKLGICYSGNADAGYCLDNLSHLCRLEKLKLEMDEAFSFRIMHGRNPFRHLQSDESNELESDELESNELESEELEELMLEELKMEMLRDFSLGEAAEMLRCIFFRRCPNPVMLKSLTLSGWRLPWNEMKFNGSLPNLQVLKLRNYACSGREWETIEGEYGELRLLLIDRSGLAHWSTKSSHFPRLECLIFRQCDHLYAIPSDIGNIPTLKLIEVNESNGRGGQLLQSAVEIQQHQRDSGNDSFQVRVKRSL